MAVDIAWDQDKRIAVMVCTTTDTAFGPIFTGPSANVEAGEFLDWLHHHFNPNPFGYKPLVGDGKDPRDYDPNALISIVTEWRAGREREPDGIRYIGGGNYASTDR